VEVFIAPILAGGSGEFSPARGLGCQRIAEALRLERYDISLIDNDLYLQGNLTPDNHRDRP
jgi:diaminohydroxyphosphoribosylaminopyrimidine deaminase/5-amino-6-(5-phosphoribosylamino)uracil reductase